MTRTLQRLAPLLAVVRLDPDEGWPWWATTARFASVTRTPTETSVVCDAERVPTGLKAERDFVAWRVVGTLDFGEIGVLSALTAPLAQASISCFAVSTFDTDYLLVRAPDAARAERAWVAAGIRLADDPTP